MCDDKVGSIEEVINVGFVLIRNRMFECWISISVLKMFLKMDCIFIFFEFVLSIKKKYMFLKCVIWF